MDEKRTYCNEWYARKRQDPLWVEKYKQRRKERYQELIKDDAWREERNRKQREFYRRKREKKEE